MILPLRRIDRKLSDTDTLTVLRDSEYGFLTTLNRDGRAQFTCVLHSRTVPFQFTVEFASCMADGVVRIVEDEAERWEAMRALCQKYDPRALDTPAYERAMRGMPAAVMLRMEITAMSGKANRGQLPG